VSRKTLKSTANRAVSVNGKNYASLRSAAKDKGVSLRVMQRAANGEKKIEGLEVKDVKKNETVYKNNTLPKVSDCLLRYPKNEKPIDRGLPERWR